MRRWYSLLGVILLASMAPAADVPTDELGNTLWPSQHGAPPGYPGVFDDMVEVTDKESGEKRMVPKYPRWGHPELLNYPGSVEHFRHNGIKYTPAYSPFNHKTLVRNWILGSTEGFATEPYAEPIYYMPMYNAPLFTGKHRAAVPAYRLKKDGSNAIELALGKLPRGMYVVRLIGAIPVEPNNWSGDPQVLVLGCTINDGPDGAARTFTRRHRAVDQFYSVGEWYFHAVDDREFKVRIAMDPLSEVDLLVHNVDLHNPLAECAEQIVKTKATIYTTESRAAAQAYYEKNNQVSRDWGPNIQVPKGGGLWKGEPLSAEDRAARDEILWTGQPPELMNLQDASLYGKYDAATLTEAEKETAGDWEVPFNTRYRRAWDQKRYIVNKKLEARYTFEDLLAGKPLPGPHPDRGFGIHLSGRGFYHPVLSLLINDDSEYQVLGHSEVGTLCVEYFNRNNTLAARDAAFILARIAYTLPSELTSRKRWLQQVVSRPAQTFSFNDPVLRRFTGNELRNLPKIARSYDLLFDYIKDNQELATAVGRYVPWIRTPDDLRTFFDQRLLQFAMVNCTRHRVQSSHGTPEMAITLAVIAQDKEATRPLMDWLFSRTWDYPLPLSGVQDYAVTGTTRDGTTSIGSFFYTAGGSPVLPMMDMVTTYIANGGDQKYNLADTKRYPKPFFGAYFNLDGRVAGMYPLGVGDVGGQFVYGHQLGTQEDAVRTGYRYLKDATLAWILKAYYGRRDESDAQWKEIETAAAKVTRNPWMAQRSRVLATWAGILEGGKEHDDFRFRRAATVRVGLGWGHSHRDTLDLQVFAMGLQMTPDGGQRPGYGRPDCITTMNHNLVEVDGDGSRNPGNWEGHAWIRTLADVPGAEMLHAKAIPPLNKQQVKLAERTVALVGLDPGMPSTHAPTDVSLAPGTVYGKDVVLPSSYVLDVYRVSGGKRHTYCFHGPAEDQFEVNAQQPRQVPMPGRAKEGDADAHYLRRFVLDGYQGAGDAPPTVVATWRMGRDPFNFDTSSGNVDEGKTKTYKCGPQEQRNLGPNYDPTSPRKYVRLHLLNQQGARLMWGRWVSAPYTGDFGQWFTQLYAQRNSEADQDNVFVGVIESYAGRPAIASVTPLAVANNDDDVLRAVAVAVEGVQGRRDVLFADGRPGPQRQVSAGDGKPWTIAGQYAIVARKDGRLHQAAIVGGAILDVPGVITIKPAQASYTGVISHIDHLNRQFVLNAELPGKLVGRSFWDVGNDRHGTSLEVVAVDPSKDGKTRVRFRKGLELVSTRVQAVDRQKGIVTGKLASILMGMTEDNDMKPGMTDGLWASNEDMTKWWSCTYTGGTRADGYNYQLTGAPLTDKDFPVGSGLRIWELGATDHATLATMVSVRRHRLDPDVLEITANVPFAMTLPADAAPQGKLELSGDRVNWRAVDAPGGQLSLDAEALDSGTLYMRAAQ